MPDTSVCADCDPKVYEFVNTSNLEFFNCSRCNVKLCSSHFSRAKDNGNLYGYGQNYAMCDQCCWFEIG